VVGLRSESKITGLHAIVINQRRAAKLVSLSFALLHLEDQLIVFFFAAV